VAKELILSDVRIEHFDQPGKRPAKRVRASVGETVVELSVTFGADDGPRLSMTREHLQAQLDAARERARAEALWQEQVRLAVKDLV